MPIGVLGAGAVGGYFGARLAAAGVPVTFLVRGAHAQAIRAAGLRVISGTGDLHLHPVPVLLPDDAATVRFDLVPVTVKMYDLEAAAARLLAVTNDETAILPLQNGIEAAASLRQALPGRRVLGGVAYIAAALEAPGVVRHSGGIARLLFGYSSGGNETLLRALADACRPAGVDGTIAADIELEVWRKFAFLAPFAAITCFARAPIGRVRADPALWGRFADLVRETVAVGRATGAALPEALAAERIAFAEGLPTEMKSSMLHDLEAGRRLELSWLTGAVWRLAQAAGMAVPVSEATLRNIQAAAA